MRKGAMPVQWSWPVTVTVLGWLAAVVVLILTGHPDAAFWVFIIPTILLFVVIP